MSDIYDELKNEFLIVVREMKLELDRDTAHELAERCVNAYLNWNTETVDESKAIEAEVK